MNAKRLTWALGPVLVLLLAGCGTVKPRYRPQTLGPLPNTSIENGLVVSITPMKETIARGDTLRFNIAVHNSGTEAVWFPRKPEVMFMWFYPNGMRDNLVFEFQREQFYTTEDAVLLAPDETYQAVSIIKTYYFAHPGITEFRALCHAPHNTNPALSPFWSGRTFSNSYGILVEREGPDTIAVGKAANLADLW